MFLYRLNRSSDEYYTSMFHILLYLYPCLIIIVSLNINLIPDVIVDIVITLKFRYSPLTTIPIFSIFSMSSFTLLSPSICDTNPMKKPSNITNIKAFIPINIDTHKTEQYRRGDTGGVRRGILSPLVNTAP